MQRLGSVVDGKYEILKEIGRGGMSVVYLAMDKRLNKQWAVKEINKTGSSQNREVIVNSLVAEANLMKRLDHPALPRIVDIIEEPETIFVVMDYIEGESLDKILKEYGPQPEENVIEWAKQLCDALNYLHSQKPPIIYRDMKPANVMLKPEGFVKVIDFGIAREYKEQNLADTTVLGTKGYAPPEQHGSRQTDARSDIYALGMTMHHLLTGVDPRPADYLYVPIRQWNPQLSGGLERVIDKCTALDPEDRYQNCNELMYALEHYEEADDRFKQKQKKRLLTFVLSAVFMLVFALTGIAGRFLAVRENDRDYEQKIGISPATPYEEKVDGNDSRAYLKLLEAYQDHGIFGDDESSRFNAKFNTNKELFAPGDKGYLDLNYEAGVTYLYLYSGGDNSFRNRVLKAHPHFLAIVESGDTEYEYYDVAKSLAAIGDFYQQYVINATSVKEPDRAAYDDLLESLNVCVDGIETYDYDDAAYVKLTMYRETVAVSPSSAWTKNASLT